MTPLIEPKNISGIELYPATFGLISWLCDVRKNPAIMGSDFTLNDVAELCYAFSVPSETLDGLSAKSVKEEVKKFMHVMTPERFNAVQKHAEAEILKYFDTIISPKKKQTKEPKK